jgi:excinuclease ABC subunit A
MREADYIIDMGPGAGVHGGKICAEGDFEKILKDKNSITAKFLSKKREIKTKWEVYRNKICIC